LCALLALGSAIANEVQIPDASTDAGMFGRVWNEPAEASSSIDLNRRQVVAIASEMLQFGQVGWQLEWPGEAPQLVLDASELAG
jgi:hypothetical protein